MLEVYGPSISTVSWTDWPRHRKVLAAPFNENIMCHVWDESLSQAEEMLQSWIRCAENGTLSVVKDTRTLSLNVLAATGFRRPSKFRSSSEPTSDEAQIYRDALQTVLDNAIFLMLVPPRLLLLPLLPRSWARIGKAAADFRIYMLHMLSEETKLLNQGGKGTGSLMTSLVRALDNRPREETFMKDNAAPSPLRGLTADEILGNIFTINFAGHDTTANTLAFSMLLLAAHPECQEWVAEELQECTKELDSGDWDYCVLFPKLKRCRAVLVCVYYFEYQRFETDMYLARDPSPLSSNCSSPKMEQSAPPTALHRREKTHNPTSHRCHTEPPRDANPSEILARSPRLATIPLDPSLPRSRILQRQHRLSSPTPSRRNLRPRAERILPLV